MQQSFYNSYKQKGSSLCRKSLGIVSVLDFFSIIGYWFWMGSKNESLFLLDQFRRQRMESIIVHHSAEILLYSLFRSIFVMIVYVKQRSVNMAPLLIVVLVGFGLFIVEILMMFTVYKQHTDLKLIFMGISAFYSLLSIIVLLWAKRHSKESARNNILNDLEKTLQTPSKYKSRLMINENSPLIDSLSNSTLFRTPTSLEDKLKRYSIANINGDKRENYQEPILVMTSSSISSGIVIPSYPRLVALLLDPITGIPLLDKKHRFKNYFKCFSGKELLDWLLGNLPVIVKSRSVGLEIGNQLIHCGYIEPLNSTLEFIDSDISFYAFTSQVDKSLPVHRLKPKHISHLQEEQDTGESSDFEERNFDDHEEQISEPFIPEPILSASNDSSSKHLFSSANISVENSNEKSKVNSSVDTNINVTTNVHTTTITNQFRGSEGSEATSKITIEIHNSHPNPVLEISPEPEIKVKRKVSPFFQNFMNEMRDPDTGIPIKDRKQHISARSYSTYHRCFIGSDAVDWIVKKMNLQDRHQAVKIGQKMIEAEVIHHVMDKLPFLDSDDFYRFRVDDE